MSSRRPAHGPTPSRRGASFGLVPFIIAIVVAGVPPTGALTGSPAPIGALGHPVSPGNYPWVSPAQVNWPKYHFDAQNTGSNPYENQIGPDNVASLTTRWTVRAGVADGALAVNGGVIYSTGNTQRFPSAAVLTATDASTGTVRWQRTVKPGKNVWGLAYSHGILYFGTDDLLFRAFDARTGGPLWTTFVGATAGSPTVVGGIVYFAGTDDNALHTLDAHTGAPLWEFDPPGSGLFVACPTVADGVVYVGATDHNLYALDALTGARIWTVDVGGEIGRSAAALQNGVLFVGVGTPVMELKAIDAASGTLLWSADLGKQLFLSPASPAVAEGVVYAAGNGDAMAFSAADGGLLWKTHLGTSTGGPVVANGVVYITGYAEGDFWALDAASGGVLWSFTAGKQFADGEVVANGMVFAASADLTLYAFRLP